MTVRGLENTSGNKHRTEPFSQKVVLVRVSCSSSRLVDLAMKDVGWTAFQS